jgi:hypothetical protein
MYDLDMSDNFSIQNREVADGRDHRYAPSSSTITFASQISMSHTKELLQASALIADIMRPDIAVVSNPSLSVCDLIRPIKNLSVKFGTYLRVENLSVISENLQFPDLSD